MNHRMKAKRIAQPTTTALLLLLFGTIGILLILLVSESSSSYEQGMYDGAHDLCQELGGTWHNDQQGWCDQ